MDSATPPTHKYIRMRQREQGWRSGESARLPLICLGFDSRTRRHMWIEFVVGSRPCSKGFSPGSPVFLPPQKILIRSGNSGGRATSWKCHCKFPFILFNRQTLWRQLSAGVFFSSLCDWLKNTHWANQILDCSDYHLITCVFPPLVPVGVGGEAKWNIFK